MSTARLPIHLVPVNWDPLPLRVSNKKTVPDLKEFTGKDESFQKFVGQIVQQVNVVHKVRMYLLVLRLRRGEGQGIRKSEATKN